MADLTPAERERLVKYNEELVEAIQVMAKASQTINKILLHGYQAEYQGQHWDNRADLERETGDVQAAIDLCCDAGDLNRDAIQVQRVGKRGKITKYMRHQSPDKNPGGYPNA